MQVEPGTSGFKVHCKILYHCIKNIMKIIYNTVLSVGRENVQYNTTAPKVRVGEGTIIIDYSVYVKIIFNPGL